MHTLQDLATQFGAELRNAEQTILINQVSTPQRATGDALVFAEDETSLEAALQSQAAAIAVSPSLAAGVTKVVPLAVVRQPKLFFARVAHQLSRSKVAPGIHPSAVVASDVQLGEGISIGPCAVVESGAVIGARSRVDAGAVIGEGVHLGEECHLYPRVVLYPGTTLGSRVVVHAGAVLGGDGFGYVRDNATGEYLQFPQQGVLILEDDVEIGANTTIDRGALEETRIERGVKIDNLVHLGHNVRVGQNVVIAAQTGVSGSTVISQNAVIGGQVGMGDHAFVGEGVIMGSQSGLLPRKKLKGKGVVFWGTPAKPLKQYLKELATLTRMTRI